MAKTENKVEEKSKKKDKNKKSFFSRIARGFKETFSELKKVTWPTVPKAIKATCVVLVVVLIFTVGITIVNLALNGILIDGLNAILSAIAG